jgi:hypothetical protein
VAAERPSVVSVSRDVARLTEHEDTSTFIWRESVCVREREGEVIAAALEITHPQHLLSLL